MFKTAEQYYKEELDLINMEIMVEDQMFQDGVTSASDYKAALDILLKESETLEKLVSNPNGFIVQGDLV